MSFNRRIKNLIVLLLVGIMAAGILLTGCGKSGGGGGTSGSGLKILYTMPTGDDFKYLLRDALAEKAKAQGASFDVAEECTSVNMQVEQIQKAVKDGYDAIVCLPVDRATALQLEVAAGDLPIIYVNACPDEQYLKKNTYVAVSSYEEDAGEYQAEYVWNKLGKPSSMNIVIIRGQLTHNAAIARSVSVKNWLKDNGVEVNVVFDDTANWSTEEAANVLNVFLKTNQPFDAVFCNNDGMALGIVQAMKAAGLDLNKIPVVGVDATADGCKSIAAGDMQFTVYQSANGQADKAIQTAISIVKNGNADGIEGLTEDGLYVWVPFEKVDASNVKDYMN